MKTRHLPLILNYQNTHDLLCFPFKTVVCGGYFWMLPKPKSRSPTSPSILYLINLNFYLRTWLRDRKFSSATLASAGHSDVKALQLGNKDRGFGAVTRG